MDVAGLVQGFTAIFADALCVPLMKPQSYRISDERVLKNRAGVAILSPVRRANAWVKCFVLWLNSQSGCAAIAETSTGTSASW